MKVMAALISCMQQSSACLGDTVNCHPKGSVKGKHKVRNVITARSRKQEKKDHFQPVSLSARAASQLLCFQVQHIHGHSQHIHVTACASQCKDQCCPANGTNIQHPSPCASHTAKLWAEQEVACHTLHQTLERQRSPALSSDLTQDTALVTCY